MAWCTKKSSEMRDMLLYNFQNIFSHWLDLDFCNCVEMEILSILIPFYPHCFVYYLKIADRRKILVEGKKIVIASTDCFFVISKI